MNKTVTVSGIAEISWSVELPEELQWEGGACDDPAVEAVLCASTQDCDIHLFGLDKPAASVHIELHESDVTVEDDDRKDKLA